jgi:hypothetical protein
VEFQEGVPEIKARRHVTDVLYLVRRHRSENNQSLLVELISWLWGNPYFVRPRTGFEEFLLPLQALKDECRLNPVAAAKAFTAR